VLFLINAATFGPLIGVIARWRSKRPATALPREHVREAVRAGGRYVRASPVLRVVLLRTGLFSFFASAIWAVLPLVRAEELPPRLGRLWAPAGLCWYRCSGRGQPVAVAPQPFRAGSAAARRFRHPRCRFAAARVCGPDRGSGGGARVRGLSVDLALSTLNSLYQLPLPQWVKTRGMSFYLVVFQGGTAFGSALSGVLAQHNGLRVTMAVVAAGLMLGPVAGLRYALHPIGPEELQPTGDWPEPVLVGREAPHGHGGPVQVTVEYFALAGTKKS